MKKLTIISSILIFLIIITASISIISLNKFFYPKVKDYDQEETLALNNVVSYLNNKEALSPDYFNEREISHMKDVKEIFDIIKTILVLSIISFILIISKLNKREVIKSLRCSSLITLAFIIILVIFFLKFDIFFNIFHNIFFKDGTWLFQSTDMLIRLFPFNFFPLMGLKIIKGSLPVFVVYLLMIMHEKLQNK